MLGIGKVFVLILINLIHWTYAQQIVHIKAKKNIIHLAPSPLYSFDFSLC